MKALCIFYFSLSLLITGCKPSGTANAPESFHTTSNKGLVIGTITFDSDSPKNDIYRFFYEPQNADKKFRKRNSGKIMIKAREGNTRGFNGDFNEQKSYLFIIHAEPGPYAFTQYNYLNHIGPTGVVTSSKKFSIPFEVKKGHISYMGSFLYNDASKQELPKITILNNFGRDITEFKKKFPGIDWEQAEEKIVSAGNTGEGLIMFPAE